MFPDDTDIVTAPSDETRNRVTYSQRNRKSVGLLVDVP